MNGSIKEEALKINWQKMEEVINFYESNQLYFNNYMTITSPDSIVEIIQIKQRYIEALESKKRFTKAKPVLSDIDILLQKIRSEENYKSLYERYLFLSGLIARRLEKNQESLSYFVELRKIDPKNELYKKWYFYLRSNVYQNQFKIISFIGLGLIFLYMFLDLFFKIKLSRNIILLGFLMMISGIIYPTMHKYFIKMKQDK